MSGILSEKRGAFIGVMVGSLLLLSGSVWASTAGLGVDKPPPEEKRQRAVRSGGHFFIFYTGGFGNGPRGINGRTAGGGPGRGK